MESDTIITMFDHASVFDRVPRFPFELTFSDGDSKIGSLKIVDGQLGFEGNVDESARIFFEYLIKLWKNRQHD